MLGRVTMNANNAKSPIHDAMDAALNRRGGAAEKIMRAAMMARAASQGDMKTLIENLVDVRETRKEMRSREDADKAVMQRLAFLEDSLEKQSKELNRKFDRVIDIFERKPDDVIRRAVLGQRSFTDARGRELTQNNVTGRFERRAPGNKNAGTDKQDGLDVLRGILDYQKKIHAQNAKAHGHAEKGHTLNEKAYRLYTRTRPAGGFDPGPRPAPGGFLPRFQPDYVPGYSNRQSLPPASRTSAADRRRSRPQAIASANQRNMARNGAASGGGFGISDLINLVPGGQYLTGGIGGLLGSTAMSLAKKAVPFASRALPALARRAGPAGAMLGLAQMAQSRNILAMPDANDSYFDSFMKFLDPNLARRTTGQPAVPGAPNVPGSAGPNMNLFSNLPQMVNPRSAPTPSIQPLSNEDNIGIQALQDAKEQLLKRIEEAKKGKPRRNFRDYRVDAAEREIAGIDNQIASIRSGGVAGGTGRAGAGGGGLPARIPGVTPGAGQTESQAQTDARQRLEQAQMPAYNPQFSPGQAGGAGGMTLPGAGAAPAGVTGLPITMGATGGQYRPEYSLGQADLDPKVLNVIAGEARLKNRDGSWNQEGTDAVINNMLNRVGSRGWGPSDNLLQVATAPGQYAGSRPTSQSEAEYIQSRIKAIASGSVPDNTQGSNSYRAEGYYQSTKDKGRGYWAGSADIGPNIGGNRFGKAAGVANGPYAQYADGPRGSTPAISASIPGLPGAPRASMADIGPGVMGDQRSAQFASIDPSRIRPQSGETAEQLATRIQQMAPGMPSQECVALAKSAVGVNATPGANSVSDWRRGEGAQDGNLVRGTPVATFLDRNGKPSTRYDGGVGNGISGNNTTHAAVFDSYATDQNGKRTGINVWEQYDGSGGAHMKTYNFGDRRGGTKAGENYYSVNSASNNNAPLGGEKNPMASRATAAAAVAGETPAIPGMPQAPTIQGAMGNPVMPTPAVPTPMPTPTPAAPLPMPAVVAPPVAANQNVSAPAGIMGGMPALSQTPGERALGIGRTMLDKQEVANNADIQKYLKTGGVGMDPAKAAWCSAFVGSTLKQAGIDPVAGKGGLIASNYLGWGTKVDDPNAVKTGDTVVRPTDWKTGMPIGKGEMGGHAAIATGETRINPQTGEVEIKTLQGNHGDSVGEDWQRAQDVEIRRSKESVAAQAHSTGATYSGGMMTTAMGGTGSFGLGGISGSARTPPEMSTPSRSYERQPTPTPAAAPAMAAAPAAASTPKPNDAADKGGDDGADDAASGNRKMSEIETQINDFGIKALNDSDAA